MKICMWDYRHATKVLVIDQPGDQQVTLDIHIVSLKSNKTQIE